jgi:hypothetical protein
MTAKTAIWRRVFLIGFLPSRLTPAKLKTVPHARETVSEVAGDRASAEGAGQRRVLRPPRFCRPAVAPSSPSTSRSISCRRIHA